MSRWLKIRGTIEALWQIGIDGPLLKNSSNVLEVRDSGDTTYSIMRGADPTGLSDFATSGYLAKGLLRAKLSPWTTAYTGIYATQTWNGIAAGNGLYIAVCSEGYALISKAGYDWNLQGVTPASTAWVAIAFGAGLFAAVSSTATTTSVSTTTDGVTWSAQTTPNNINLSDVIYGGSLFVAVASAGAGNRILSSPDGVTWTSRVPPVTAAWVSVTYGNGQFMAVAADGQVMVSANGLTWSSGASIGKSGWTSITYGNGVFVAVGNTGDTACVAVSASGASWSICTAVAASAWSSVAFAGGVFVAVASSGASQLMASFDGIYWVSQTAPLVATWSGIVYGCGRFVAIAKGASGGIMLATNQLLAGPVVVEGSTYEVPLTVIGGATQASDMQRWYLGNVVCAAISKEGWIRVGSYAAFPTAVLFAKAQASNTYLQGVIQNTSNGASASTDMCLVADTGDDSNNYLGIGINSSGYNNVTYGSQGSLDSYMYAYGGSLHIGTFTAGKVLKFYTAGALVTNLRLTIGDAAIVVNSLPIQGVSNPTNAQDAATKAYVDLRSVFNLAAPDFDDPGADWSVTASAALAADPTNAAILERRFDDTTSEGVGCLLYIPVGATRMRITYLHRSISAPGANRTVGLTMKVRQVGTAGAVLSAWVSNILTDVSISGTGYWQRQSQIMVLTSYGLSADAFWQFEFVRNAPTGGTNLAGDWALAAMVVEFTT